MQQTFDDIRPYHDDEVRPTLDRLFKDKRFLRVLAHHYYPRLTRQCPTITAALTGLAVRYQLRRVHDVASLQAKIEAIVTRVIRRTTSQVSFSGIEQLEPGQAYLFLSNHRDIVLDPALVNYGLYQNQRDTVRIAIGDNLVNRPFVSDLMRLNKSFIVKRSLTGRREKLAAYQTLSAYIHHSIHTGHSVWLAHSEGRAKDGNDRTDPAIIKMLRMDGKKAGLAFADSLLALNIVPVAISYEYDPCDQTKAKELYALAQNGHYQKQDTEDLDSIVAGIEGFKGHVHVAFGAPLQDRYDDVDQLATAVDQQIHAVYQLQPSNVIAWEHCQSRYSHLNVPDTNSLFSGLNLTAKRQVFNQRLSQCDPAYRHWLLAMYAQPVINRYSR